MALKEGINTRLLEVEFAGLRQKKTRKRKVNPEYAVCLFCCFTSQVNSYGHGGTVSSPNYTFSWASLNKQLTST